jgi:hypothetical protein
VIKAEIWLHDSYERQVFFQAAEIIEQHRRALQAAQGGNAAPGQRVVDVPPAAQEVSDETQGVTAENPGQDVEPEAPVAHIAPDPQGTAPKVVTLADMEKAAQAAIQIGGLAQVRAMINEYGKSRIREIDGDLWPEVMEKLANVKPLVAAE